MTILETFKKMRADRHSSIKRGFAPNADTSYIDTVLQNEYANIDAMEHLLSSLKNPNDRYLIESIIASQMHTDNIASVYQLINERVKASNTEFDKLQKERLDAETARLKAEQELRIKELSEKEAKAKEEQLKETHTSTSAPVVEKPAVATNDPLALLTDFNSKLDSLKPDGVTGSVIKDQTNTDATQSTYTSEFLYKKPTIRNKFIDEQMNEVMSACTSLLMKNAGI